MAAKRNPNALFFYIFGAALLAASVGLYVTGLEGSVLVRLGLILFACLLIFIGGKLSGKGEPAPKRHRRMKGVFTLFFAIYCLFLANLLLFDSGFGRVGLSNFHGWDSAAFESYAEASLNLVPLKTVTLFINGFKTSALSAGAVAVNLFGNLVAFLPFAFFLPLLFEKERKFGCFILTVTFIVMLVEIAQFLLMTGACDVDDLILNVGGASIFYLLLKLPPFPSLISYLTK